MLGIGSQAGRIWTAVEVCVGRPWWFLERLRSLGVAMKTKDCGYMFYRGRDIILYTMVNEFFFLGGKLMWLTMGIQIRVKDVHRLIYAPNNNEYLCEYPNFNPYTSRQSLLPAYYWL